ncbi:MAG: hypothetical protein OXC93_15425, partial [Rhodospirillaceae bacterium]|nr:hypothetical protein [Rhodospirillaceae bacterium]
MKPSARYLDVLVVWRMWPCVLFGCPLSGPSGSVDQVLPDAAIAGRAWVLSSPKRRLIVPERFPEGRRGRLRTAFDHGAERGAFSPVGRCRVDLVDKALLVAAREGLVSRRGGR